MNIHVAADQVTIECKEFDYSRSANNPKGFITECTISPEAYIRRLCDEISFRIFLLQEELSK